MILEGKRRILVTFPLVDESDLDLIRAVDPSLEVVFAPYMEDSVSRHFRATQPLEEVRKLKQDIPQALLDALPETEILMTVDPPVDLLERAPKLRWVNHIGSGTDQHRGSGILESDVILTNSKGISARTVAEFVMAQLLALSKQFPRRFELKQEHHWQTLKNVDLFGRTLGIVGLGEIGTVVARFAKTFGLRVVATKRTITEGALPENVDRLYRRENLHEMLGQCFAVVIAVPYTSDTRDMIGATELAAMPPGSYLLDVARGGVLNEEAFVAAMKSGHLAGAALDVFKEEPLPSDSPLWDLPNLIISPHNSVGIERYGRAATERFIEQLQRYLRGEPLQYVVTAEARY